MAGDFSPHDEQTPEIRVSATLRIFGNIGNLAEITQTLKLSPTHIHRQGEKPSPYATQPYEHDMWMLKAPLPREELLEKHLLWLKEQLSPHREYLRTLAESHTVDIFCGYRTDSDQGGFDLSPEALRLFTELGIRMCVSIIIA
ncbi:MAG: DUF4279 domain-containing protein [Candidatus Binatia bacterium]